MSYAEKEVRSAVGRWMSNSVAEVQKNFNLMLAGHTAWKFQGGFFFCFWMHVKCWQSVYGTPCVTPSCQSIALSCVACVFVAQTSSARGRDSFTLHDV